MDYAELARCYAKLEATPKKLEKRDILSDFYAGADDLNITVLLSMGQVFPSGEEDLGVASELMKKIIIRVSGSEERLFNEIFKETGDLGLTAERLMQKRRQAVLGSRELTVSRVFENLRKLPGIEGKGSVDKKISLVAELLSSASPEEAKYIVRTVLGEMRVGVAAGIARDAIAKAFSRDPGEIERLFDVTGDFGRVAILAREGREAKMELFAPIRVMLAERAKDLREAVEKFERSALEIKYDGFRVQCHKDKNEVKIFSRRMEDISEQFPEIVSWCKESLKADNCIVEGEVLAVKKDGKPLPFQLLSRRIQRKYDIDKMVKEVPVTVKLFDLIYMEGKNLMASPFSERWDELKRLVKKRKTFGLADHIETTDFETANKFYREALSAGQEGVIVKNLDAPYQPGKRVGYWLKVKEIMETLDCVITKAIRGEGKKHKWFSSFVVSVWDEKKEKLVEIGRMASGTTEEELEKLTVLLNKNILKEEGIVAEVKPKIVLEVGYEEIQKSPKYESGMALRFPRLVRIRYDKSPGDIDSIKRALKIFGMQK